LLPTVRTRPTGRLKITIGNPGRPPLAPPVFRLQELIGSSTR